MFVVVVVVVVLVLVLVDFVSDSVRKLLDNPTIIEFVIDC
jgi:hypothetical protein